MKKTMRYVKTTRDYKDNYRSDHPGSKLLGPVW